MQHPIATTFAGFDVTVETDVDGNLAAVFDFVTAEDVLPKVLKRYGLVPRVIGTRDVSGRWDTPGSTRTVLIADGSTAREEVTLFDRPRSFGYMTDRHTSVLKHLATSARGRWCFEDRDGRTHFRWTYSFAAKNISTRPLLALFLRLQWAGYMRTCAANIQKHF